MKKTYLKLFFLMFTISVLAASCASSERMGGSKKGCGCGAHKGYVGY
jgi:hypothetical protein